MIHQYIDKPTLKSLCQKSDWMGTVLVLHCWAVIILSCALFIVWPNPLSYIVAVFIIGSRQLGLAILMHDGAHGLLFKNKKLNDWAGKYLVGLPIGSDLLGYRRYHMEHHLHTQQDNDPDLPLSDKFPITKQSLWRKVIRDLTGQTGFKQRLYQLRMAFKQTLIVNVVMLVICWLVGYWWVYFALWLVPLLTVFQLVLRIRNIAEHAVTERTDNPLRHARTTYANWLERAFIAPYWVNYHVEHHVYMSVPCWQLKTLHQKLLENGYGAEMEIQKSYFDVLNIATAKPV